MRVFKWNADKNLALKTAADRGVCFEDIVAAIENGGLLDDIAQVNSAKYAHQRVLMVLHQGYVYAVPYVREDGSLFLKTVFPSRKLKVHYLKGLSDET